MEELIITQEDIENAPPEQSLYSLDDFLSPGLILLVIVVFVAIGYIVLRFWRKSKSK